MLREMGGKEIGTISGVKWKREERAK